MQKVDLYLPILHSKKEPAPLTLRVGVQSFGALVEGGTAESVIKPETYVLLSALPIELRQKVTTAIQALLSGM